MQDRKGSLITDHENKENVQADPKPPNEVSYLYRLRLNVLSELNLLDHELSTLVELHNLLKLEMENNHQDNKMGNSSSKGSKLEDIRSIIKSVIRGYRENEASLESNELASLLPLAFIQDPDIFQDFLGVFLEDLRTDILFDAKKVKMFSFILVGAMGNKDFKQYCKVDNLIQCLKILKPKIEDLSITAENMNIQEALNSLNDILFLFGFIGAEGIKNEYALMVEDLVKFMETHKLEKAFNLVTKKSKDPSLHIKREYALEALKRIKLTKFEAWEENLKKIMKTTQIAVNLGKGILTTNVASINEALFQLKDLILEEAKKRGNSWYNHVNELRFLVSEPIEKIKKELFVEGRSYSKQYTFFVAELLLSVINQPLRKLREKKRAAQILWFLANGYEDRVSENRKYLVKSRKYKLDRDIRFYVKNSLVALSQNSDLDFSIFIRKLIEPPLTIDAVDSNQINLSVPKQNEKVDEQDNPGKRFYIKMLMEKKPKLFGLAKIEKHSEKTLDKPTIMIEFRGIDKEKNFDESMIRKSEEMIGNMKGVDEETFKNEINKLDANTKSNKLIPLLESLSTHKEDAMPNKEKDTVRQMLNEFRKKIKEINEKNAANLIEVLEGFINEPSKSVLLIQGDAGAGKTLLLHLFEQTLWKRYNTLSRADSKHLNRLPLRIPLSEVRNFDKAVDEFLLQNGCNPEAIYDIKKEPAVILFDGYDEINQNINLYNLNKLETWRDVKVIFTSRKENLTALKEDYILCFTPGNDKQRVLSYIIQPINEKQIREYFNAQVKENQHKIKKIEEKLKALNGNRTSMVSIAKIFQKDLDFLNKLSKSGKFIFWVEVQKILEDHLSEVELIGKKVADLNLTSLKEVFQEKIDKMRERIDEGFLKLLAAKMESNLVVIKEIEDYLEVLNNEVSKYNQIIETVAHMKKLSKLTNLKKICESLREIRISVQKDLAYMRQYQQEDYEDRQNWENGEQGNQGNRPHDNLKSMMDELKELDKKLTPENMKAIAQKISQDIVKIKEFEKKVKTLYPERVQKDTVIITTENAENYLPLIQSFDKYDKLRTNFQNLYQSIEEYRELKKQLGALIRKENDSLKDSQSMFKTFDDGKWKIIGKMQQRLEIMKQILDEEFGFFPYDFFYQIFGINKQEIYYKLSSMDDVGEEFDAVDKILIAYGDEERLFMNLREGWGLSSLIRPLIDEFERITRNIYFEQVSQPLGKLEGKIAETQEVVKELMPLRLKNNDAAEIVEAVNKQIEALRDEDEYKYRDPIAKLGKVVREINVAENESKTVKEDISDDDSLNIRALNKEIREIEQFGDPENLEFIIQKFKDIITSPFMLRMLLQTLVKFPKSSANRAELYRLFATIHFEREKDKLLKTEKVPPKFNIIDSFSQYSKDLAVNMFIRKVTSLQAKSSGYKVLGIVEGQKKNIWSRFFDDQDVLTKLSKRGAQIIEDDGVVRFVHKSIMEYFAARQFYDEILDYNPDNQEDFDPCLNKGMIVDNETAVYLFMKDIANAQTQSKFKEMTTFDKKLLEVLNSTALQKKYGNDFELNYFYPNLFLILLLRGDLLEKALRLKEDSVIFSNTNNILKWVFSNSEASSRFADMLCKVYESSNRIYRQITYLLCSYYHFSTKQEINSELGEELVTAKRNVQAKVKIIKNSFYDYQDRSFGVKNGALIYKTGGKRYSWVIEGKLFINDSLDSVIVLRSEVNNKYFGFDFNKEDHKNDDTEGFVIIDTKSPWDLKECKWILRMDQIAKEQFTLVSIADPSKILYGSFEEDSYHMFFKDFCSCDIHAGIVENEMYYFCVTCDIQNNQIVCKGCAEACHKDHETVEFEERGGAYCDCRFMGCCEVVNGCTDRFIESYNNIVMYKCKQCPAEKKDRLLCLACKKHHEKEHQKFEKVKDSGERCGCDCPSSKAKLIANAILALKSSDQDEYYDSDDDNKAKYDDDDEDNNEGEPREDNKEDEKGLEKMKENNDKIDEEEDDEDEGDGSKEKKEANEENEDESIDDEDNDFNKYHLNLVA